MQISSSCFAVTGLGYATPWCVNAGIVVGGEVTLIVDTGANAMGAATIHGYAVLARPANMLVALNTEGHFDHIGGNCWFRDRGIDVWGHESIRRSEAEFQTDIEEFNRLIPEAERRERLEGNAFYAGTRLANPNRAMREDMHIDLGGLRAEILLLPGHTPGNIAVWVPQDGVVYTGDALVNLYTPNLDAGGPAEWRAWLNSLDRLERLESLVVVPGHGPVVFGDGVPALIRSIRGVLEEAIAGSEPAEG
jgi:glyoxylase-like metal-dependent hydrolase (beta-lactamase superfamily II)